MILKYAFAFLATILMSSSVFAQSPIGLWKTIDDETKEAKSHVEIYEVDGKLHGKVVKLLKDASTTVCENCSGAKKNQPIEGMEILEGLTKYKDYWSYGKILDPANGKIYKCSVWTEGPDKLKLRGYIGISALGRNQVWHRVE